MIGAKQLFTDRQRTLKVSPRAHEVALFLKQTPEARAHATAYIDEPYNSRLYRAVRDAWQHRSPAACVAALKQT